jgi:glycosyltransferase involved in cell wall biosynthesis
MVSGAPLNVFYGEPDGDRWLPYDRYPRKIIRRILRGRFRPGGQARVFLNLCAGLDRLGISYRVNDYGYVRRHPSQLACIVGKPDLLDRVPWRNPILFGAAIYSHPTDDPSLLKRLPIKKILVPGPWMTDMCKPYWGESVEAWPVGIDTTLWAAQTLERKTVDVLIYDKVRWHHAEFEASLIEPIRTTLRRRGLSFHEIRYGSYREEDFHAALAQCRTMIFLCEHETQGIAYQQALSCGVPIFAWDRQGPWQDPSYYPDKVIFQPVTSVPYWDDRCGLRFTSVGEFEARWDEFWGTVEREEFRPRDYILDNLTLEKCAGRYLDIVEALRQA